MKLKLETRFQMKTQNSLVKPTAQIMLIRAQF